MSAVAPDPFDGRRRALGRTLVGAGALGLVIVAGALVAAFRDEPTPADLGQVDLQVRPVLEVNDPGGAGYEALVPACEPGPVCPHDVPPTSEIVLEDAAGTRYRLGPSELSAADVVEARPEQGTDGSWSLVVRLTPAGVDRVARLTASVSAEAAPRDRVAIVIDGALASVPVVAAPVTGAELAIVGDFDADEAASLAARLTPG